MDTKKEDTNARTAPESPAMPAPREPGPGPSAVPSGPLHGPVDVVDDSLEGLQLAFGALSVEEVDTNPVKRKREREKDAGESMADKGVDHRQDPTSKSTFEGAPSASNLHASPSHTTTTLPTPDPAAATSTPITTPPKAEGTGFTGMPTYPAYGVDPSTTAFPEATTGSEPVASSSAPRWYAADYHHPLPATGAYVDVPGYPTLSGMRRGPESCGSRCGGLGSPSNRSGTRSEINEALRGATSEIVGDLTQEIRAKLDPLILPQASPTIVGVSPHRVQANHLVAGLTNTLGILRSRPMPTLAVIPRSPFVPRTTQPPYSHVGNSTRAELDQLGLTALRAMVDVEPYGSSDLDGEPSDDEPPSMYSASPSEDDDPENPENPSGRKKKKKRKTSCPEGRSSHEAKATATSKIVVNLPEFTGKDLSEFAENSGRFLRMTGQTHASGQVKCDLLLQCCKTKYLEKQVKQIVTEFATFADVLLPWRGSVYLRNQPLHHCIRAEIQNLAVLPNNPKPARFSELLADLDHWAGRLTPGSLSCGDLLFWLVAKLPRELWDECPSTAERKARALNYEDLSVLLFELALDKESNQHLNAYRPGGGGSGSHGKGYQGSRPGQGTTPKHARIMDNVKELFWCDARDEHGHLQHAPDCEQRDCFEPKGRSRRPTPAPRLRCRITTGVLSPAPSVGRGSTTRMSATTSSACRRRRRARILAKTLARAAATATATTPARASQKDLEKDKTRAKVDAEEALTASQTRTTRTRTRSEATPTLIQGGTPSPLGGSLVLPHARKFRPSESEGPSVSMKVLMTATRRREAVS